ncbi:MAG TPA: DUF547 domain-containing protein [Thermoanaerobaculia bacterium]|nr:DUF547 domain-containing protein [Thermoanaerobaculia bacterium]
MKTATDFVLVVFALLAVLAAPASAAAPPDYTAWGGLLTKYYDPAKGMNYKALKANDKKTLDDLRHQLGTVDVVALSRPDQLAYWINLYNVNVVGVVVDNYPVSSIKDISTDPIIRLNVFKKDVVQTKKGAISLNDVENDKIREGFKDPRIHFAINCAAKSCPPIRTEPYEGAKINDQLDDQVRKFLAGPKGTRLEKNGGELTVHATKILDWFSGDFQKWGSGQINFLKRFVPPDQRRQMDAVGNQIELKFDDYDWNLNDASGK